jgi:hypothetical protein
MIKQWLGWVNYAIAGIAICLALIGCLYLLSRPSEIMISDIPPPKTALPKTAFAQSKEACNAIGEPLLSLQFSPMSMQLPDLKKHLVYYGKNGRPDAIAEKTLLHFSFTGNKSISSVTPGERLYILFDRKLNPPQYVFSPNNAESSLWMEAKADGGEALVKVAMKKENGEILHEPECNANFTLPEKEYVRTGGTSWEIGKNRVDATLLARQKARWYGPDVFLEKHGGKEYADKGGKQRIDFGDIDDVYSIYAGLNDTIVWVNDQWKVVPPGHESLGKPMLIIKKIEDRLMNLELWDPEGKGKITLNLLKSSEPQAPVNIPQKFKFVGSRTRTQFVFEIDGERMLLSPYDWLLLTKEGWVKLQTPDEIDAYVERKTIGPLFVFDRVERKEDHLSLEGTLFNTSRTDMQSIEIPLQQTTPAPASNHAPDHPTPGKLEERTRIMKKTASLAKRNRIQHNFSDEDDIDDEDE